MTESIFVVFLKLLPLMTLISFVIWWIFARAIPQFKETYAAQKEAYASYLAEQATIAQGGQLVDAKTSRIARRSEVGGYAPLPKELSAETFKREERDRLAEADRERMLDAERAQAAKLIDD